MKKFTERSGSLFSPSDAEIVNHLVGIVYHDVAGTIGVVKIAGAFIASEYYRNKTEELLMGNHKEFELKLIIMQASADDLNKLVENNNYLISMMGLNKRERKTIRELQEIVDGKWVKEELVDIWGRGNLTHDGRRAVKVIHNLLNDFED